MIPYNIKLLKQKLGLTLPGKIVQYSMAPSDREDRFKKQVNNKTIESAVLILLFNKSNELYTVFIQRPKYDGPHGGQISFPGGKYESDKDKNLQETAIRECFEEIGVSVKQNDILGKLTKLHIPISNICVLPYIAYLNKEPTFILDKKEVDDVFTVKIAELLNSETKKVKIQTYKGTQITIPYFDINNKEIWGATAMILNEFLFLNSN